MGATNAKGFSRGTTIRRIVVSFDDETFDQIHAAATREGTSFAEQVRCLVEIGLEDAFTPDREG